MEFLKELLQFVRDVASDERIPKRDKTVILALLALAVSPLEFIPVVGLIDEVFVASLILDYLFNVLDQDILLSHYPWDMKSFIWLKRGTWFLTRLSPRWVKNRLWKFQPSPYKT